MKKILNSIHPDDDLHYEKMGLKKDVVEEWEDGMHTDGSKGTYEWWYFDSHYPDGTKLVIFFYSKSPIDVNGPIKPMSTMELTFADGTSYSEEVHATIKDSYYAKETCDVKIGDCSIKGDLKHYDIIFKGQRLSAKVSLTNTIPAWRSQTGTIFFGDNEEHYFAWLPAAPEGNVVADIKYNDNTIHLEGSGYHDHNWGNMSMLKLMHHWYWGRAKIGEYKVISSWITGEKKYGYKDFDVFMLAKNDKILGDNSNHTLKFLPEYLTPDNEYYRITYNRKGYISKQNFVDLMPSIIRLLTKLIGFEGSYLRFEGEAIIEKIENNEVVEKVVEDSAVWELMYFGKACADKRYKEK